MALTPGGPGERGQGSAPGGTRVAFNAHGWQACRSSLSPTLLSPSGPPFSLLFQFETPEPTGSGVWNGSAPWGHRSAPGQFLRLSLGTWVQRTGLPWKERDRRDLAS